MTEWIGYGIMLFGMIVGLVTTKIFVMFPFIFIGMCLLMGREILWRVLFEKQPVVATIEDVLNSGVIELASGWIAMLGVYYILKMTTLGEEQKSGLEARSKPKGMSFGEALRKVRSANQMTGIKAGEAPYLTTLENMLERLADMEARGALTEEETRAFRNMQLGGMVDTAQRLAELQRNSREALDERTAGRMRERIEKSMPGLAAFESENPPGKIIRGLDDNNSRLNKA